MTDVKEQAQPFKARTVLGRIGSTVATAWGYAAVYTAIAILLFAVSPGAGQGGFSLPKVVVVYWVAATVIGIVVGVLRPLATTPERRFGVAFIGVWPAVLGIYVAANDLEFSLVDRIDLMIVSIIAAVYAAYAATQRKW